MNYVIRPKPKAPKNGLRVNERDRPSHRKWLRLKACVVPGCQGLPIVVAHVRSSMDGGIGVKPHDAFAVPMCDAHHLSGPQAQHSIGEPAFEKLHGIDLMKLALMFASKSPDERIREKAASMKELV